MRTFNTTCINDSFVYRGVTFKKINSVEVVNQKTQKVETFNDVNAVVGEVGIDVACRELQENFLGMVIFLICILLFVAGVSK